MRRHEVEAEHLPRYEAHVAAVARALDYMVEHHGVRVLMVAMDRAPQHGSDDRMGRDIIARMQHKERVSALQGTYAPKEIKGIMGVAQIVAGGRMHGLILATGEATATCGVCFSEKMRQFARLTGQDHLRLRRYAENDGGLRIFAASRRQQYERQR